MRLARFLVASVASLTVGCFGNFAIGQTWEGDSIVDPPFYYWSDGTNWLLDTVPTSSSTALFVNNGANSKNIDFAGGANIANGVRFAAGSSAYTFRPFSGVGLQLQGSNSFLENLGGNNQQINAGVTFSGAGSKTISATSTGGLQFGGSVSNTAASALTISKSGSGAIAFTGSLTSNAGLAITNSNTTGTVTIGNATVSGSTVSVGGTGATSFTGTLTNAAGVLTLTKAGTGTLSTSGISSAAGVSISNSGTGATTIGSISNTSGNVAISNSAATTLNVGAITGGGNLQITNSDATGVVRLNNNVGASTVSFSGGGRVEVASGVTVSGTTAVSGAGSSLTGLGSFGNSVVIQNGGTLSPGVSGAGSLAFNGGLAFDSGSTFSWDLVNETTGFDTVAVSGGSGLSINSGATSVLNISNAISASFWNTNQSWNVFTGTFAAPGSVFGNITLAGAAPDVTKGFFTWSSSANGVTLNFTAVPEPSSMALLGLAGVIGGVYARRRSKLAKNATVAC